MTDLLQILPSFPLRPFAALIPTIEQNALTTTDLLTLHPADIAKQTRLPILDLKRLIAAVQASLSDDLTPQQPLLQPEPDPESTEQPEPKVISTLDDGLDAALGGGVPVGVVTEITGESGAGKTQALLSLCLAVQLPPPHGLGREAVYISTEAALATSRLAQMLNSNPILQQYDGPDTRPSLDAIHSAVTPDLETQDHILNFQVPVLLSRHNIGLIVLDSVAANYRAEFERQGSHGSNMAARSAELVRLGALLRDLARRHNLAVVVANQVADRFSSSSIPRHAPPRSSGVVYESPLASRSMPPPSSTNFPSTPSSSLPFSLQDPEGPPPLPALMLDHQQRWFTGWGDDPHASYSLKTPSLGLVWSTQIACRVALFKRPFYGRIRQAGPVTAEDDSDLAAPTLRGWRRWMKVVFAPHVASTGQGLGGAVEFEVTMGGLKTVKIQKVKRQ
ncbi:related to RAD57 protein [Fusarium torulosum]|uniref:Related to RAD57 protein n=1 Tax=Fusarium torulosum TaxID=33205 RepID=A0AAE8ML80_9HYPO|nr:related to RAD57 protein [Fusarium torulosum]